MFSVIVPFCSFHIYFYTHWCRVRKGMGSQSVVICVGKYPGGRGKRRQWVLLGLAKAVGYICMQLLAVRGALCSWPSCTWG